MTIRVAPSLAGTLPSRARGRTIVIDAFRSRCCGSATWVGDITVRWADEVPATGFAAADPLEGVPVRVREALVRLLERAGPSLHETGLLRRDGLRVELDRPELWLDWLERGR
jgi:hypothetical protein